MADTTPHSMDVKSDTQAGFGVNNQAYQPDTALPPPYPQPYPPQPLQQGTVAYYPNQYPTAPTVYAPQPYQPYPPQPNQQTTAVIVNAAPPPIIVHQAPYASYCGMIVLACFVFWCCNPLFGLIAFILAVVADSTKGGDPSGARKLGKASMWLSIVGIIVAVIVAGIVLGVSLGVGGVRTSRYVSPYSCCRSNGYEYPYSGSYCYGGIVSSYSSSSCPYYYYSYGGYCYSSRYYMTASLCCYSNEYSYSASSSYCYRN